MLRFEMSFFRRYYNIIRNFISESYSNRFRVLQYFIGFLFCLCIFAIGYRTILSSYKVKKIINLNPIYDKNNNFLAYNVFSYGLNINPREITSLNQFLDQIKHIDFDRERLINGITKNETFMLIRDLKYEDIAKIKHRAIEVMKFTSRKYPLGKNFTTIGFANLNSGIIKGIETMAIHRDVFLTIDIRVQNMLASSLEIYKNKCSPQSAFGVIVNMKGEILAMHTTNSTEPSSKKDFFNNLLYGSFEFGSTCKIFTMFAGLYYRTFSMDTIFDTDEGKSLFNGEKILYDYEPIPRFSNIFTIISMSSNRGTVAAQRKIGSKLVDFFKLLKLNSQIDLDFTKLSKPKFFNRYKDDEIASFAFGYNFQTNIFNMTRAFLSIFNNGRLYKPKIFRNSSSNFEESIGGDKNVYENVIKLMEKTAERHKVLKELKCASKSGTVDRVINGKYDTTRVNAYYVCVVPGMSGKYEYLMILVSLDPLDWKKAGWNLREVAARIASNIFSL